MASFWDDFAWSWAVTVFVLTNLIIVITTIWFYLNKTQSENEKTDDKEVTVENKVSIESNITTIDELEDIKEILLEEKGCCEDFNVPATLHDKALLKPKNKIWKEEDSLIMKNFFEAIQRKKRWEPLFQATKFLEKYLEEKDNKIINSSEIMSTHALNILYATAFGKSFELNDPRILGIKTELETMITLWPKFGYKHLIFKDESDLDLIAVKGEFMTRMKQAIMLHAIDEESKEQVFVDELNQIKNNSKNNEEELAEYFLIFFFCGYESLAKFFSSAMMLLAENVEIQEKMFNNLKNNISSKYEMLENIPFIQAALRELLRKVKPVPFITRTSSTNFNNEGELETCPCLAKIDLEELFENPKYWDFPEKFNPSQFLSHDSNSPIEKEAFIPFSIGSRSCPGQTLTEVSSLILLTSIVQKFRLSVSESLPETDQNFSPIEIKIYRRQEENAEIIYNNES